MRVNYLGTENYNQNVKSKIYVSFIGFMLQYSYPVMILVELYLKAMIVFVHSLSCCRQT